MSGTYNCIGVTVSLRPSPISEENACFGVIMRCDAAGFFSYKLAVDDEAVISRILNFFPKYGRQNLMRTMNWAAHDIDYAIAGEKNGSGSFKNLIRPRENVIRYGAPFVVSTDNPAAELSRLYATMVSNR